jgi:hypothetical protein
VNSSNGFPFAGTWSTRTTSLTEGPVHMNLALDLILPFSVKRTRCKEINADYRNVSTSWGLVVREGELCGVDSQFG